MATEDARVCMRSAGRRKTKIAEGKEGTNGGKDFFMGL